MRAGIRKLVAEGGLEGGEKEGVEETDDEDEGRGGRGAFASWEDLRGGVLEADNFLPG